MPANATSPRPLRVLVIEDDVKDAKLILHELRRSKPGLEADIVQTPERFQELLRSTTYDIILSDYNLQDWSAKDVLDMLRAENSLVPVVVVSGMVGEEAAVECIKKGASDYILKDRMARLPIAIDAAIARATMREEKRRADDERLRLVESLRAEQERLRTILEHMPAGVVIADGTQNIVLANRRAEEILGQSPLPAALSDHPLTFLADTLKKRDGGEFTNEEVYFQRRDGATLCMLVSSGPIRQFDGDGKTVILTFQDITEKSAAQRQLLEQEAAIRELSTPVLQVSDRLLIVPLIGRVDQQRARQLTEQLLREVRKRRAKAVVVDLTGVPFIDASTAMRLVQTFDACRLMGAAVFATGISSKTAQSLAELNFNAAGITVCGDLQTGIEEARLLLTDEAEASGY